MANVLDTVSGDSAPTKPYRKHARVAWILMAIVTAIAMVPVFGFASWIIAAPMLLVSFVMIILVFANGGVSHGLVLLFCQIVVMPMVVIGGPILSSALGLSGTAAGITELATTAGNPPLHPAGAQLPKGRAAAPSGTGGQPDGSHVDLPAELKDITKKLQDQQPQVVVWLQQGKAMETPTGYLHATEAADIETRRGIAQQNKWREAVFGRISAINGESVAEVAGIFAKLAAKKP